MKKRSREEDGKPLKKLGSSDPGSTYKLSVTLLQGVVLWKSTELLTNRVARILSISTSIFSVLICIKVIKLFDSKEELTPLFFKNCCRDKTIKVYYYMTHLSASISFLQDTAHTILAQYMMLAENRLNRSNSYF